MLRTRVAAALLCSLIPGIAAAQTSFWDFVSLNAAPAAEGGPLQAYSSRNVTNPGFGTATFTGQLASGQPGSARVLFQWYNSQAQAGDEKGVGVCRFSPADPQFSPCYTGDEVGGSGDTNDKQWLILDLTNVTAGSILNSVRIASMNHGESFLFEICTNNLFTTCTPYTGVSGGLTPSIWTININAIDQARRWLRFKRGAGDPNPAVDNGYIVQGITTTLASADIVSPEPSTVVLLATGLLALLVMGPGRRKVRRS